MIWWGYAGFSGVMALIAAVLAAIVGLSSEIMLNVAGLTAGGLLAFGVAVHLLVLMLRATARSAKRAVVAPRVEPAFLRPQGGMATAAVTPQPKTASKPVPRPGALDVLFPQQAAR